jgi:hypothetical protein
MTAPKIGTINLKRPFTWKRFLLRTAVLAAVLSIVGLVLRVYYWKLADDAVAAAEDEADRLDPGWRWEDLEARRARIPDEKNGALCVLAAAKELPKPWPPFSQFGNGDRLTDLVEDVEPVFQLSKDLSAEVAAAVKSAETAQAKIVKLIELPSGRYEVNWTDDFLSTKLPHVDACRNLEYLQLLAAAKAADEGDGHAVLTHAHLLLNIGRSIGDEPCFISALHRVSCQRSCVLCLERLLAQTQCKEPLEPVQQQLLLERRQELFLPALRGERVAAQRVYRCMATGEFQNKETRDEFSVHPIVRWLYAGCMARFGQAQALTMMNQAVEIGKKPLPERLAPWKSWSQSIKERVAQANKSSPHEVIGLLMLPAIDRVAEAHIRSQVLLDCGGAALAAERYRQAVGQWPASLQQLVPTYLPAVPADLFGEGPLLLRQLDDGIVIYSVGADGVDDNGNLQRGHSHPKSGTDLGFRLWNPEKRRQPPANKEGKERSQ